MNTSSPRFQQAPLAGRLREINVLYEQYQAALAGRGGLTLVSGEAGIGKSRLVAEVRSWAAFDGIPYLEGSCFEPDHSLPYALVLDLLQRYLERRPDDAIARDVAQLLPEVGRTQPAPAQLPVHPDHERRRIGLALRHFVARHAANGALLVILEDLHWSDDTSLDTFARLARLTTELPILLLATYRHDEIDGSLRHVLAALDRQRLATELRLPPLTRSDVEQLVRAQMDQSHGLGPRITQAICELTDGNPFFVEEILRSLRDMGDLNGGDDILTMLRIPRSVHDAVLRRVATLSPTAEAVLRRAAVAGREFDFDVLQALTMEDEGQLIAALRELVDAQLLIEASAERFAFRHALTRQAVYRSLLALERRGLHRAVGEALEREDHRGPDQRFADLSYHFAAAEVWEKALEYGTRAGKHALKLRAPRAAIDHFDRAIEAATRLGQPVEPERYHDRGWALSLIGEFEAARQDYLAALARAQAEHDRDWEWQALHDLGNLWGGYDYAEAGRYFEQALALARTLDSLPALAASLTQIGSWYLNIEQTDHAERSLEAALAIFEQMGDRAGIARVIDLLGTVSDIAGDIPRMRRRYERALALFRDLDDRQGMTSPLSTMLLHGGSWAFETVVVSPRIPTDAIRAEVDEALALARAVDWRAGEAYALVCAAITLGPRGAYGDALDWLSRALTIAREIAHHEWLSAAHLGLGVLRADLLEFAGARDAFALAHDEARVSGSLHFLYLTTGFLAETEIRLGNIARAEELLTSIDADLPLETIGQRRVWFARALLAQARGELTEALAIVDRFFSTAHNLNTIADIPLLALLRGQVLHTLGQTEQAGESLQAALHGALERQLRPLVWRVWLALAQLHSEQQRAHEADAAFRSAWEIIEELAGELTGDELRAGFVNRALAQLPSGRARPARQSELLTRRERDVALLVAQGLSNRAVAEHLSIGERTVETHVSNVLGKLGFRSRAQIAAWVTTLPVDGEYPYQTPPNSVPHQSQIP